MQNATQNNSIISVSPCRIIKATSCPTLSGKGTLQYHLGTRDGEILFRVHANSGSGFFSREWISMSSIQQVSNTIPVDKPVTSFLLLNPVYVGRSQNSPGFLMAVLVAEGLVEPVEGDERVYWRTDGAEFYAGVKALIDSDVDIKVEEKPTKASKSAKEVSVQKSDVAAEVIIKKPASSKSGKK
jgi:hypothetical protein